MRVKIAKNAGFCMGVKRAMDIVINTARNTSKKEAVYTDGPLIHNPQVLEFLEQKGIGVLKEDTNPKGVKVVIRAHGIKPERKREIEKKGANVCDATCPNVKSVQSIINKYATQGYSTVIVGDKGHAEVDGLLGYSEDRGYVVEKTEDVASLPAMDKVCVVSQTTQSKEVLDEVTAKLKERYKDCKIFETICSATSTRQEEVISLSNEVEAMVVVGGKGSANTKRLADISEAKVPTFLVETEEELDMEKLKGFKLVGVTAGASTPNWMIDRVAEKIQSYEQNNSFTPLTDINKFFTLMIRTCVYLSIGTGFLSYSNSLLLGVEPKLSYCLIASLFVFSLYMLNNLVNKRTMSFNEPCKSSFYEKHHNDFMVLGISGIILSVMIALFISHAVFYCLFFTAIFGALYGLRIIPKTLSNKVIYSSLAQIPGSKEIYASTALTFSTALIIYLGNNDVSITSLGVTMAFTMAISFVRGVFLDVKDIQEDSIAGKEAIPVAFGKKKTKVILVTILILTTALLTISPKIGLTSNFSYYLLPCIGYACCYLYLYHKRLIKSSLLCEAMADFNFILTGIMAYIWSVN